MFCFCFGGSNGQVRIAILASLTFFGICGCKKSLSTTTPLTKTVSSNFPPILPSTLINSKSTPYRSISATAKIPFIAISAICL
jgi:hypothetical protein